MRYVLLSSLVFSLASCSNVGEQNDLSKAQQCLNQVPESDPASASDCMTYIQAYSDQQASILKCAILETSGGLIESKIVTAYNQLKNASQTIPTAAFLTALSLNVPTLAAGYATAKEADTYCQASGVPGLKYVSSIILAGTFMLSTYGSAIDPTDPSSVSTMINSLISDCNGPTPSGTCDPTTLGSTVLTLSTAYCSQQNSDQSACSQVSSAVSATNGDPTEVGQAFLCYLNNQTYDPTSKLCI